MPTTGLDISGVALRAARAQQQARPDAAAASTPASDNTGGGGADAFDSLDDLVDAADAMASYAPPPAAAVSEMASPAATGVWMVSVAMPTPYEDLTTPTVTDVTPS